MIALLVMTFWAILVALAVLTGYACCHMAGIADRSH